VARPRLKHLLEWALFLAFVTPLRVLSRRAAIRIADAVSRFAFDVVKIRREVALRNVTERLAPAGGRAEAERIARASYVVIGRTFVDLVRMDRLRDEELWSVVDRAEVERMLTHVAAGKGGVLVGGHFGNWELLVQAFHRIGIPVCALAADQANPYVNRHVARARGAAGVKTLSSRRGLREAFAALRASQFVATLMDQDARGKGIFVDFLGTPTATHTGMISLAMRTGSPVVPGLLIDEGERYRFVLADTWRADPGLSDEENLRRGVEHFNRFLEKHVRANPENYFWAHRRWKTRPPAEDAA
jgi:KDO2-lipid IV(A) lauroyltransferase